MLEYKDKYVNLYDQGAADIEPQYLDWKWKMAATSDNKYLIGLPIDVAPVVLYYRSDLFAKAGVPSTPDAIKSQVKTWDDYFKLLKQVKDSTGTQSGTIVDIFRACLVKAAKASLIKMVNSSVTKLILRVLGMHQLRLIKLA